MSKLIQVRNVPDEIHRKVKARAAMEGTTLSDLVLREIVKAVERPSRDEVLARIRELPPIELDPSPAEAVREERQAR